MSAPGWYPDPTGQRGPRGMRYWDGQRWVDTIPPPPKRPASGVDWKVMAAIAGAVLVTLVVAVVLAGGGDDEEEGAVTTTTSSRAPLSTRTTTSAPTGMRAWMSEAAGPIGDVGTALTDIGQAMQVLDFPTVRATCPDLRAASDQLERTLPSPRSDVTAALQDGVDDFRSVAMLCVNADLTMSPVEREQMGFYLDRGAARMCDAYELMGLDTGCRG